MIIKLKDDSRLVIDLNKIWTIRLSKETCLKTKDYCMPTYSIGFEIMMGFEKLEVFYSPKDDTLEETKKAHRVMLKDFNKITKFLLSK